jgi:hypothetical protein
MDYPKNQIMILSQENFKDDLPYNTKDDWWLFKRDDAVIKWYYDKKRGCVVYEVILDGSMLCDGSFEYNELIKSEWIKPEELEELRKDEKKQED